MLGIDGLGTSSERGANAWRGSLQTLLVVAGCGGEMGLLALVTKPREALAKARHPRAICRSSVGAGVGRSEVVEEGVWTRKITPRPHMECADHFTLG